MTINIKLFWRVINIEQTEMIISKDMYLVVQQHNKIIERVY